MVLLPGTHRGVHCHAVVPLYNCFNGHWVQEPDRPTDERRRLWRRWDTRDSLGIWRHDLRSCLLHCWNFWSIFLSLILLSVLLVILFYFGKC